MHKHFWTKCIGIHIVQHIMKIKQKSEIANWDENEVRQEFDDGTVIRAEPWIRREAPKTTRTIAYLRRPPNRTYWVKTSDDKVFEFSEQSGSINKNKAGAIAVLWYRSGGFKITDDCSLVPVKIAALGKPAIASYLDVTQNINREEIAELLNVSKGTVEQYVSKVRRGHR